MTKLKELKASCDAYQTEQMTYDQFRKLHNLRGNKAALSYAFYKMSLKEPKT